jgi:hypothetical protein
VKPPERQYVELLRKVATEDFGFERGSWEHGALWEMYCRGWLTEERVSFDTSKYVISETGLRILQIADALNS